MSRHVFGEMIRKARKSKQLTQVVLAAELGITQSYLSRLEGGERVSPSLLLLRALASRLDLKLDTLIESLPAEDRPPEEAISDPFAEEIQRALTVSGMDTATDEEKEAFIRIVRRNLVRRRERESQQLQCAYEARPLYVCDSDFQDRRQAG